VVSLPPERGWRYPSNSLMTFGIYMPLLVEGSHSKPATLDTTAPERHWRWGRLWSPSELAGSADNVDPVVRTDGDRKDS
jgi:hypothetical protein